MDPSPHPELRGVRAVMEQRSPMAFALALADAHTNFMRVGENLVPVCFGHNYQDHTGALGGLRPEKGVHDDGR